MPINELSQTILDTTDTLIYVADIETYELEFINKAYQDIFSLHDKSSWYKQKCYKILHNLDSPCTFCNNHKLNEDEFYCLEFHHERLNKHFYIKDKLVQIDGVKKRFEYATDVTERSLLEKELANKLSEQMLINNCVKMLHSNINLSTGIYQILSTIGKYYEADRSYIFEIIKNKEYINNTYEWCANKIPPQIDLLQQIDIKVVEHWFTKFRAQGDFYITSINTDLDKNGDDYKLLQMQKIDSLIAAPLIDINGNLNGFLGVDNPRKAKINTLILRSMADFIGNIFDKIDKNLYVKELYDIGHKDTLTGLHNRHSYNELIRDIKTKKSTTIGILYADINGLKTANDTLGHKAGDYLILSCAKILYEIFENNVYRIGGDEFVVLCPDIQELDFVQKIDLLQMQIKETDELNMSIGYSFCKDIRNFNIELKISEDMMYQNKKEYYQGGSS